MSFTENDLRDLAANSRADAIHHDVTTATADSASWNPLKWVDYLPEVGEPILRKRADIGRLLDRAADLEAMARQLRGQAYSRGLALESHCASLWSDEAIEAAKQKEDGAYS